MTGPNPTPLALSYDRLVAPSQDGAVLVEPSSAALAERLRFDPPDAPLLDRSLSRLRSELRAELGLPPQKRLIATGHQVECFHAGVFAKTIAADLLSSSSAPAAFLWVDSDLPKDTTLRVPVLTDGRVDVRRVPLPGLDAHLPTENASRVDLSEWTPLLTLSPPPADGASAFHLWAEAARHGAGGATTLLWLLAAGQTGVERALGLPPSRPIAVSRLCRTTAFRAFFAAILRDPHRFAACYNSAQAEFRAAHRVRNPQRPAPLLEATRDRVELPFWVSRPGAGRRRLLIEPRGGRLVLLAENEEIGATEPAGLASCEDLDERFPIPESWSLRPRALTFTAFVRLLLSDLFLHGIGGAKYDGMMEQFCAAFFGVAPAPMRCVTATVRLPLPAPPSTSNRALPALRRDRRDLTHNPQRHLSLPAAEFEPRAAALEELMRLRGSGRRARPRRRELWLRIRQENSRLLALDGGATGAGLDAAIAAAEADSLRAAPALDREYFYAFHSVDRLAALRDRLQSELPAR